MSLIGPGTAVKCRMSPAAASRGSQEASAAEEGRAEHSIGTPKVQAPKLQTFLVEQPDGHGVACAVRLPSLTQHQEPANNKGTIEG